MKTTSNVSLEIIEILLTQEIQQSKIYNWPYITAELVIAVLSIFGNMLVCVAIWRNKKLQTITNYFLMSLAVADFLVGALAIPCALIIDLGISYHNYSLCIFVLSMLIIISQSSIFTLLLVAIERYIAIILPFHYRRLMKPRTAKLVILLTWILACVMGLIPLMGFQQRYKRISHCVLVYVVNMTYMVYFNFFGSVLTSLLVLFFIYTHIFITVRKHLKNIANMRTISAKQAKRNMGVVRKVRKTICIFLIVFLFIICLIPLHIILCVRFFCPRCKVPSQLILTTVILSHANSVFNPLLYAYRMKSFYQAFKSIILCQHRPSQLVSND